MSSQVYAKFIYSGETATGKTTEFDKVVEWTYQPSDGFLPLRYLNSHVLPSEERDKEYFVCRRYDNEITKEFTIEEQELSIPKTYSKLKIVVASKQLGKWPNIKSWIEDNGYEDEWLVCQYITSDYPGFQTVCQKIVSDGVLTGSELKVILNNSISE